MNTVLNIDASAVVEFTQTLRQMHRSAIPNAIRDTLNNAAFDVKTRTMPDESNIFFHRKKNFFKANSKVEQAKGWEVDAMRATVGFVENNGTQQQAVEDMQQQDAGGSIGGRTFIPLDAARVGGSHGGNVRAANRISQIRSNIVDAKNAKGANNKQRFIKSAIHAGKGGVVIGNTIRKGKRMMMRINSVHRLDDGNTVVNSTPLYSVQAGRHVHPKATHFMRKASLLSGAKIEGFYIKNAEKQMARLAKK